MAGAPRSGRRHDHHRSRQSSGETSTRPAGHHHRHQQQQQQQQQLTEERDRKRREHKRGEPAPADRAPRKAPESTATKSRRAKRAGSRHQQPSAGTPRKVTFVCALLGARQTGKRSIVKCFVKLLDEFRLAAKEYKRERVLNKLIHCSEQLQDLAHQQELERERELEVERRGRAARPAGGSQSLGVAVKRRLNSVFAGSLAQPRPNPAAASAPRRHTAYGCEAPSSLAQAGLVSGFQLAVPGQPQASTTFLVPHGWADLGGPPGSGAPQQQQQQQQLQQQRPANAEDEPRSGSGAPPQTASGERAPESGALRSSSELNFVTLNVPSTGTAAPGRHPSQASVSFELPQLRRSSAATQSSETLQSARDSLAGAQLHVPPLVLNRSSSAEPLQPHQPGPQSRSGSATPSAHAASQAAPPISLRELHRRRIRIRFKTRRQLGPASAAAPAATSQGHSGAPAPDCYAIVYAINNRDSFEQAAEFIRQLRLVERDDPLPLILIANKIDLERAKEVKREEGRALARRNSCKFMEISCAVGYNLDNLLAGIRTQLILKHHVILNSPLCPVQSAANRTAHSEPLKAISTTTTTTSKQEPSSNENILVRFYKRYVADSSSQNYDCDNFLKL